MSDGERGGVEATARKIVEAWADGLVNVPTHPVLERLIAAIAAALRAAPPSGLPDEALSAISIEHERDHSDGGALPREGCNGCRLLQYAWTLRDRLEAQPPSGLTPPRDVLTILRRPIARLAGEDDPGAVANGYDWKYLLGVLDRALAPTSPVAGAPQHEN